LSKKIHIISFDVPFPPNYGGVIDVFFKIKALKSKGVNVILHCFIYGREKNTILEQLCEKVYYYPRQKKLTHFFSLLPFIVRSRINKDLKKNLMQDQYPILFEGLHTCFLLNDKDINTRLKIYRESNIEHEYYFQLAKIENNIFKKIFFYSEAIKLRRFEKKLVNADIMLIVSESETDYFKKKFPAEKVNYLPSFHGNEIMEENTGQGNYALFHGKLSVPENHFAAMLLLREVFSKLNINVVIAGMDPSSELIEAAKEFSHIKIVSNPSMEQMAELIKNAHIHCLYSAQATGLKLKLLNVLYHGRFIVLNDKMIVGTGIDKTTMLVENDLMCWKQIIERQMHLPFSEIDLKNRQKAIFHHGDNLKVAKLIKLIWTEAKV
jgi:hypothetical protein